MRVFIRGAERLEIELVGARIAMRRIAGGKVIAEDQLDCRSALKAKWDIDRLCREQEDAGFERVGGSDDIAAPSQDELVAAIRADPDDLDNHVVYADWLIDRGDPWGQVIAVQHALETLPRFGQRARRDELERAEVELLFRHSARLWGRLGESIVDEDRQKYAFELLQPTWHCGLLRGVDIEVDDPALVKTMLDEVATLDIAIALRSMSLTGAWWPDETLEAVTRRRWPCLHSFAISDRARGLEPAQLGPILDGSAAPRLDALIVRGCRPTDAICRALAASPLAPQLTKLWLLDGEFGEPAIAVLASGQLAALRELRVTGIGLPRDARARLAGAASDVHVSRTDSYNDEDEDDV